MFSRHKSMSYPKRFEITETGRRLCYPGFKLPFVTASHLLSICIVITILNDVNTRPAKLTLLRGSKSFHTSTLQCKAGVFLHKPGTYTCACVTGLWGFYGEYCKKPVTIAAGDNYCFHLKNFTILQVVPFGDPEHPFDPTLNIFHGEFQSLKEFHSSNSDTNVDPLSSFIITTDEPWTLYGDTGASSICLQPTTRGKRKFCMFSKRPSNKIHSVRKKWTRIRKVSRGCNTNTTLVWRADTCTDILSPNDFAECATKVAEPPEETEPQIVSFPSEEPSSSTDKPRFKLAQGQGRRIQRKRYNTSGPGKDISSEEPLEETEPQIVSYPSEEPSLSTDKPRFKLAQGQGRRIQRKWYNTSGPEKDISSEEPLEETEPQILSYPSEEPSLSTDKPRFKLAQGQGRRIQRKRNNTSGPEKDISSEEPLEETEPQILSYPSEEPSLSTDKPRFKLAQGQGRRIQRKRNNTSGPEKDISSEEPTEETEPQSVSFSSEEPSSSTDKPRFKFFKGWIQIQPQRNNTSRPDKDISSDERWIKIKPERQNLIGSQKDFSSEERHRTNITEFQRLKDIVLSEEQWIHIKPRGNSHTTAAPTTESVQMEFDSSSEDQSVHVKPRGNSHTTAAPTTESVQLEFESSSEEQWIHVKPRGNSHTTAAPTTESVQMEFDSSSEDQSVHVKPSGNSHTTAAPTIEYFQSEFESSSEEKWIVIKGPTKIPHSDASTSTNSSTPLPPIPYDLIDTIDDDDTCAGARFNGLTRDKVKEYWLYPDSNVCSRSITDAVFTDQLRRFTAKQFNYLFPSRLRSLMDVELMLNYTKRIIQKTCPHELVPNEFFEIAFQAMKMFIQEDFFYGAEAAHPESLRRIIQSLKVCFEKANPFVFEYDELDCAVKQINGWIILPGKREKLEIPESFAYKNLEPLIETTWKMFLNAHSLCFSHFRVSNDHHHFAKLIMEVFSKTIYDKWIEPIESFDLYELILPNYNFLQETMQNIDYCVAAVSKVSTCPVWMSRTGDKDEEEVAPSSSRRKRSVWISPSNNTKRRDIWEGDGICMQHWDDPEKALSLSRCE